MRSKFSTSDAVIVPKFNLNHSTVIISQIHRCLKVLYKSIYIKPLLLVKYTFK